MESTSHPRKIKIIDKCIKYIINHTYIKTTIFIVAVLEAVFLPLLPEVVIAGILTYRKNLSWKLLSIISALGSVTGITILYLLGKFLYTTNEIYFDLILNGGGKIATYTQDILSQNTFVAMFLASFTPLPDRVLILFSGVLALPFLLVISAFFLARLLRVGVVAYFSYKFGDRARMYILKHTRRVTITLVVFLMLYILYKIIV